jgi:hypothetical protein
MAIARKANLTVTSNVRIVTHIHPTPVCRGGSHDKSCNTHGPEISCQLVTLETPAGDVSRFAVCTHLFK